MILNTYPVTRVRGCADLPLDASRTGVRLLGNDLTLVGESRTVVSRRHGEAVR